MTRPQWLSRIAVAAALGAAVPCVARADSLPPAPSARVIPSASRMRRPVSDTSARPERGKSEHQPAAKRRPSRTRNGAAPSAGSSGSGGYVPDQPWETEFFVSNTLDTRHDERLRFASYRMR